MFNLKTNVLVVDDMLTMRKIVSKIMRELGFTEIHEAVDGDDAWAKIQAGNYGLIISDWNMPKSTGLDLLKRIRGHERHAKIPFVLVTAEAEAQQVAEAIKLGVDQYVVKPFSHDSLRAKLESAHKKCATRIGA